MSALAPVIIPISGHGRTIGVNPAARAKATHRPPRTRAEIAVVGGTVSVSSPPGGPMVLSQYIEKTYAGERDVLALMAEGRSNAAVARALGVSEAAVGKHIGHILTKLDLPPDDDDHRRVLAVLSFLRA